VEEYLTTMLSDRIRKQGRDPALLKRASEIVVFGSYAAGLQTTDSDVDVLCVGNGPRLKSRSLDLSWVSNENIYKNIWLGSELAGHIATYGIWLRGNGEWRGRTFTSESSIERKQKRVISLSRAVTRLWDRLHPVFHCQYNVTIRRELQRLMLLKARLRIPPTRMLDDEWPRKGSRELLEFRSSIEQLKTYEGQSKAPEILSQTIALV
jgi:hypothetical protein